MAYRELGKDLYLKVSLFSLYHGDNLTVYWIQEENYTWRFPCSPFTTEIILLYTGFIIKELGGEQYLEVSLFSLYHGYNLTVYWIQEENYAWRFPCSPFTTEIISLYTGYRRRTIPGGFPVLLLPRR